MSEFEKEIQDKKIKFEKKCKEHEELFKYYHNELVKIDANNDVRSDFKDEKTVDDKLNYLLEFLIDIANRLKENKI